MNRPRLFIAKNKQELVIAAAERFEEIVNRGLAKKRKVSVALTGGATAREFYRYLGDPNQKFLKSIPWERIDFFMSDERYVPLSDSESNYKMVWDALLSKARLPRANLHPLKTDLNDASFAADLYQEEITEFVQGGDSEHPPAFDLIFLGLGVDGHTASLFPDIEWSHDAKKWVETLQTSHGVRISFLPQLINQAKSVILLTDGEKKAQIISNALKSSQYPINQIDPLSGDYTWFLDEAAASLIENAA